MSSIVPPKKLTVAEQAKLKRQRLLEVVKAPGLTMALVGGFYAALIALCIIGYMIVGVILPTVSGETEIAEPLDSGSKMSQQEKEEAKNAHLFNVAMWVGGFGTVFGLLMVALLSSALVMVGGIHFKNMSSYRWAMAGCIVCLIPLLSPGFILGIPLGVWALTVMNKPDIKKAFG